MPEAQNLQSIPATKTTLKPRQTFVVGRIEGTRSHSKGGYFVQIRCPAADTYSMPSLLDVFSKQRLGANGDDWQGIVEISGAPHSFKARESGDTINTANHYLRVAE